MNREELAFLKGFIESLYMEHVASCTYGHPNGPSDGCPTIKNMEIARSILKDMRPRK